jgi:hypothetical protein
MLVVLTLSGCTRLVAEFLCTTPRAGLAYRQVKTRGSLETCAKRFRAFLVL